MTKIEVINSKMEKDNSYQDTEKIAILVNALRLVSSDKDIKSRELYIPDDCEKYGFAEGYHNLGELLHFLADMIEE